MTTTSFSGKNINVMTADMLVLLKNLCSNKKNTARSAAQFLHSKMSIAEQADLPCTHYCGGCDCSSLFFFNFLFLVKKPEHSNFLYHASYT